jgi:hypothetical protein
MGSSEDDILVGFDEAGNQRFRTSFGTEYTVSYNPDQRTTREKIVDTVPVVAEAVKDYAMDPYLPSKDAIKDFAYDATVGTVNELDRIMNSGTATYGDIFGLTLGVGAAPRVINKVVDIAPEGDPEAIAGMFLPAAKLNGGKDLVDKANELKAGGASREDIWSKTGLWQLGDAEEWLTEIPDNKAEVADTIKDAPFPTKTVTKKIRRQVGGAGLSQGEIIQAKTRARMEAINLRRQAENGEVPPQFVESEIARIQAELKALTGNADIPEYEDVLVTKEVNLPKPKLTRGNSSSTSKLDEVLSHDELFDAIGAANVTDMDDLPTAEAGRRKSSSAKEPGVWGVSYAPDSPGVRQRKKYENKSMISAFSDSGEAIYNPQNATDKIIIDKWKAGDLTKDQARAQMVLSTMLHETQHWSDEIFDSESGSGFGTSRAPRARTKMQAQFDSMMNSAFKDNDKASGRLSHLLKATPDTAKFDAQSKFNLDNFSDETSLDDVIYGKFDGYSSPLAAKILKKYNPAVDGYWNPSDGTQDSIGRIINRFYAYRMANTQIDPAMVESNRTDFINALANTDMLASKKSKDSSYSSKGTDKDLEFRKQKAELLLRVLESDEGMNLYQKYMQIVEGKTANLRNLSNSEIYNLEMGEAKSRLVEARRDMTPEELKNTPPWLMLDREEWKLWNEKQYGLK